MIADSTAVRSRSEAAGDALSVAPPTCDPAKHGPGDSGGGAAHPFPACEPGRSGRGKKKKKDEQARHLSGGLWPLLWVNTIKETEKQQLKGARIFSEPIARAAVSGLISAA